MESPSLTLLILVCSRLSAKRSRPQLTEYSQPPTGENCYYSHFANEETVTQQVK